MNTLTVVTLVAAGGLGVLVGVAAAQVLIAMVREDYADVWDWDESEEA